MSFLFVDRIIEVRAAEPGRRATARGLKAVSRSDPFIRPRPGGGLELSPCFAGEAVGQLAAWAAMSLNGFSRRPVAGLTAEALVGPSARPGEVILLEAEIESLEDDAVHYHGRATAGGREILALRDVVGPLLPMEEFDDPAAAEREFRRLSLGSVAEADPGDAGAGVAFDSGVPHRFEDGHPAIDAIVERGSDRIVAATCVSRAAPYLVGHFPRSPVLPATFLLDGQVWLALILEAGGGGADRAAPARVSRLANLKMRDFLRPGTRVLSEVRVRERAGGRTVVDLRARVGGRTVASGILELERDPASPEESPR